jgi:hypothetical protein
MTPSPTPEAYLAEAVRFYNSRTKPDSIYAEPLFRRRLKGYQWHQDRNVVVELLPSLVLRVRDHRSGEILAQSQPGQIDQLAIAPEVQPKAQLASADKGLS